MEMYGPGNRRIDLLLIELAEVDSRFWAVADVCIIQEASSR